MRILMICLGNICRSPMAEYVMRDLVSRAGQSGRIHVDSAATSRYQIGETPHPGARRTLERHGIRCGNHRARQIRRADYERYDLLVGMDDENRRDILRIVGGDPKGKVRTLLDWTDEPRAIADPWYTGDFETAFADMQRGCEALLLALTNEDGPAAG